MKNGQNTTAQLKKKKNVYSKSKYFYCGECVKTVKKNLCYVVYGGGSFAFGREVCIIFVTELIANFRYFSRAVVYIRTFTGSSSRYLG